MSQNEHMEELLSAYVDGELTQADQQRVRIYLEDSPEARESYAELVRLKEVTSSMAFLIPPDDRLEQLGRGVSVQAPRRLGWILFLAGALGIVLVQLYLFWRSGAPLYLKALGGAVGGGLLLLLGSVLRQRILEMPHDRYRGVKR